MKWIAVLALLATPAAAADWEAYENPRFGFTLEVPTEGWKAQPDPENGDGRTWYSTDGRSSIRAWGSHVLDGFQAEAESRVAADKETGWTITADMGWNMDLKAGPEGWHISSGSWDGRMMQQKAIVTCGGELAIYVRLEHFESNIGSFLPVTDRLISSLKPAAGDGCGAAQ